MTDQPKIEQVKPGIQAGGPLVETEPVAKTLAEQTTGESLNLNADHLRQLQENGLAILRPYGLNGQEILLSKPQIMEKPQEHAYLEWRMVRERVAQKEAEGKKARGVVLLPTAGVTAISGVYEDKQTKSAGNTQTEVTQEYRRMLAFPSDAMNEIIVHRYAPGQILQKLLADLGHEVFVIETKEDSNEPRRIPGFLNPDEIELLRDADYVCLSSTSFEEPMITALIDQIKTLYPYLPIINGGWGPTTEAAEVFDELDPTRHLVTDKYKQSVVDGRVSLTLLGAPDSLPGAIKTLLSAESDEKPLTQALQEAYASGDFLGGAMVVNEAGQVEKIGPKPEKYEIVGGKRVLKYQEESDEHYYTRGAEKKNLLDNVSAKRGLLILEQYLGPELVKMLLQRLGYKERDQVPGSINQLLGFIEKSSGPMAAKTLEALFKIFPARNFTDIEIESGCPWNCAYCSQRFINGQAATYLNFEGREKLFEQWRAWSEGGQHYLRPKGLAYKAADLFTKALFGTEFTRSPLTMIFLGGDATATNPKEFALFCAHRFANAGGRIYDPDLPDLCGQFTTMRFLKPELVRASEPLEEGYVYLPLSEEEGKILLTPERLKKLGISRYDYAEENQFRIKIKGKAWREARTQAAMTELGGFIATAFGVETGDERLLSSAEYKKGTDNLTTLMTFRALREGANAEVIGSHLRQMRLEFESAGRNQDAQVINKAIALLEKKYPKSKKIYYRGLNQAFTMVSPDNKERDERTEAIVNYANAVGQRIAYQDVNTYLPEEVITHVADHIDEERFQWLIKEPDLYGYQRAPEEHGNWPHMLACVAQRLTEDNKEGETIYNLQTPRWLEILGDPAFREAYERTKQRHTESLKRINNMREAARTTLKAAKTRSSFWVGVSRFWTAAIFLPQREYEQKLFQEYVTQQKVNYARVAKDRLIAIKNPLYQA